MTIKQYRVGLSVAHTSRSSGASSCGFTEHEESKVWILLVEKALQDSGVELFVAPLGTLSKKVKYLNSLHLDMAVEIHFNGSTSKKVGGCETLYYPTSREGKRLAKKVHSCYQPAMGNKDRGIKEGWYRMRVGGTPDYFLRRTNCPAIILEPEFISQIGNITKRRFAACEKIAEGIFSYLERR